MPSSKCLLPPPGTLLTVLSQRCRGYVSCAGLGGLLRSNLANLEAGRKGQFDDSQRRMRLMISRYAVRSLRVVHD